MHRSNCNSWGCDKSKHCGIGYGNQEQFWNCADIAILPHCEGVVGNVAVTKHPLNGRMNGHHGDQTDNHGDHRDNHDHKLSNHRNHQDNDGRQSHHHDDLPPHHGNQVHLGDKTALFSLLLQRREQELGRDGLLGRSRSSASDDDSDDVEHTADQSEEQSDSEVVLDTSHNHDHVVLGGHVALSDHVSHGEPLPSGSPTNQQNLVNHAHQTARAGVQASRINHMGTLHQDSTGSVHVETGIGCRGTGPWKGDSAMDKWCVVNCGQGYCPDSNCVCDH